MVAWEPREYFHRFEVIVRCFLGVIQIPEMFVEIRVRNGVGNIVLAHFLFPNLNCPRDIFLKRHCFPHADQHRSLLLIYSRQNRAAVHVLNLYLGDLLSDLELLQGEVVL